MNRGTWTLGLALVLGIGITMSSVEAGERPTKSTFGGTFIEQRINLIPDNVPAVWSTSQSHGTLGEFTYQGIAESVPTGETQDCPGGLFVIDAEHGGYGSFTGTDAKGDQLYYQITTRSLCSLGGPFSGADEGTIVGGSGKFTGASGTFKNSYTGFYQVFDLNADPPQGFGSFTGQSTGTLILP